MPLTVFTHQIGNPAATYPNSLILSLTAAGNNAITLGTNASGTQPVKYIAFNGISASSLTGTTVVLSAFSGTQIRVDTAYQNSTFGIVYADNTSTLFTCITGTALQSLTANGVNTITPEKRRIWNLIND